MKSGLDRNLWDVKRVNIGGSLATGKEGYFVWCWEFSNEVKLKTKRKLYTEKLLRKRKQKNHLLNEKNWTIDLKFKTS